MTTYASRCAVLSSVIVLGVVVVQPSVAFGQTIKPRRPPAAPIRPRDLPPSPNAHQETPVIATLRRAAESGDLAAQNALANRFWLGREVTKDFGQALYWFRRAAEQGSAGAQNNLGIMHWNGDGVPRDLAQAAAWFRRAALAGDVYAQTNLGNAYSTGAGVAVDFTEAAAWYRRAAEAMHSPAQNKLGLLYERGEGVPLNLTQAFAWYRKAAEQGLADGQYNVGRMYEQGSGVTKDSSEALSWFRKAANQGHASAQETLRSAVRTVTVQENVQTRERLRVSEEASQRWSGPVVACMVVGCLLLLSIAGVTFESKPSVKPTALLLLAVAATFICLIPFRAITSDLLTASFSDIVFGDISQLVAIAASFTVVVFAVAYRERLIGEADIPELTKTASATVSILHSVVGLGILGFWSIIGLFFWLPLVFRTVVVFLFITLHEALFSEGHIERGRVGLDRAVRFYPDGFLHIKNAVWGRGGGHGVQATGWIRVAVETIWSLLVWTMMVGWWLDIPVFEQASSRVISLTQFVRERLQS